jgi:hypothetical protein
VTSYFSLEALLKRINDENKKTKEVLERIDRGDYRQGVLALVDIKISNFRRPIRLNILVCLFLIGRSLAAAAAGARGSWWRRSSSSSRWRRRRVRKRGKGRGRVTLVNRLPKVGSPTAAPGPQTRNDEIFLVSV